MGDLYISRLPFRLLRLSLSSPFWGFVRVKCTLLSTAMLIALAPQLFTVFFF